MVATFCSLRKFNTKYFRKRRSEDALLETPEAPPAADAEITQPVRSNGNLSWLTSSKKDYRKEERTKQRKAAKGKTGSSHLESQRLIGGQQAIPPSWPWQVCRHSLASR